MVFFSIIIACHNAENYIQFTLDSVLQQSFKNYEVLIVDDVSTDNSLDIIKQYASKHQFIKYFTTPYKLGAGGARNFAVKYSSGKWLSILDADDLFLPDKLEKQFNLLNSYPNQNLVLVGTGSYIIDNIGTRMGMYNYTPLSRNFKYNLLNRKKLPPHSSIIYKKDEFLSVGGFNERFSPAEDVDLWLRLINCGDFFCIKEPLIEYRVHSDGITNFLSKSGYNQFDLATASRVCYYLRLNNNIDLSTIDDEFLWESFLEEVKKNIETSKYYSFINFKLALKNYISCASLFTYYKIFFFLFFNFKYTFKLLYEFFYGSRLSFLCYKKIYKSEFYNSLVNNRS
jgi:glycosyltransferase involved in cell wall biosynthesis